jgi:AraC-like DNA-binding protein
METRRGEHFRLKLGGGHFGDVSAAIVGIKGLNNVRNRPELGDGDDRFGIAIPLTGQLFCGSNGEVVSMRPGQAMALSNAQTGSIGSDSGGTFLTILAPQAFMAPLFASGPPPFGLAFKPHAGALNLVMSYWRMISRLGADAPVGARPAMGGHLAELLALAFDGGVSETRHDGDSRKSARLAAAHADISAHFADPDYDITTSARRLGISVRYLQALLGGDGTHFGAELRALRLEQARRMLADPSLAHMRITDIALDCGLTDLSYFNRLFRNRFGETPSDFRAR